MIKKFLVILSAAKNLRNAGNTPFPTQMLRLRLSMTYFRVILSTSFLVILSAAKNLSLKTYQALRPSYSILLRPAIAVITKFSCLWTFILALSTTTIHIINRVEIYLIYELSAFCKSFIYKEIRLAALVKMATVPIILAGAGNIFASQGKINIDNKIDIPYTSSGCLIFHYPGASEGIDNYDNPYGPMFNPSGVASKIVSSVEDKELDGDVRPENSTSSVSLSLGIEFEGGSGSISSSNYLNISCSGFDGENVWIEANGQTFNAKTTSTINLPNLVNQGQGTYATATVSFSPITPVIESPQVDTLSASNIMQTSAKLEAKLIDDGNEPSSWRLGYGKGSEPNDTWTWTGWNCCATDGQSFSSNISNLTPLTKYFVTSEAKNSAGTTRGDKETFTTLAIPIAAPQVDTLSASNIMQTGATLEGLLVKDGNEPASWRFSYWPEKDPNLITLTALECCLAQGKTFSKTISGLDPNSEYDFIAIGSNSAGASSAAPKSFKTLAIPVMPVGTLEIKHCVESFADEQNLLCIIEHKKGAFNSSDSNDIVYSNKTTDSNSPPLIAKVVSILSGLKENFELSKNVMPEDSNDVVYLQFSIDSNSPAPINLSSERYIKLSFPSDAKFGDKPIILQQFDPSNPNASYPPYDAKQVIEKNEGKIPLPNYEGAYAPGKIDSYWKVFFEINKTNLPGDLNKDGKINFADFAILASLMGQTNVYSSADLASSKGAGIPDFKIDKNDLLAFSQKFLTETNKEPQPSPIYAFEGFETGVLNENFKTSGNTPWFIVQEPYSGKHSIRAGAITHGQTSSLEITANCKAGYVKFFVKPSSESGITRDRVEFYIDTQRKARYSGENPWQQESYQVAPGTHTLLWKYIKNNSVSAGQDTVFIDDLELPLAE